MNFISKSLLFCAFFMTIFVHASQEHKSSETAQQNLIGSFAQLQITESETEPTGHIISVATNHDFEMKTEHYSSGDFVTTLLAGSNGVRETFIKRTGKTHRVFFTKKDQD